jgi:hypothetical protein
MYFVQYFYFYFLYFVILGSLTVISWRRSSTGVEALIAFLVCFFVLLV